LNLPLLLNALWHWLLRGVRALLALVSLYMLAALLLGALAQNRSWRPDAGGVEIMLYSNGLHSGLMLPVHTPGVDWTQLFPPQQLRSGAVQPDWTHVLIGWGEQRFYLETPNDFSVSSGLRALSGFSSGALHVEYQAAPHPDRSIEPLSLSPAAYARLVAFVRASVKTAPDGSARWIPDFHYSYNDAFYEANGRFSLFHTCNEWAREALAAAGVRVPLWAPFDAALFWQLR